MSGAFQTSREIFDNPIWKNIVDFRLFFLIYGQAVFSNEGVRLADDLVLQRGQWCRSLRNLQKDLEYVENRQVKTYSLSVLNRCISRAVASQRLCTKTHELGTVFTVINYELYQGFGGYKKDNLEQDLEHSGNSRGTVEEQSGNNNKNVKKDKNDMKVNKVIKKEYADYVFLTETEYDKLTELFGIVERDNFFLRYASWISGQTDRVQNSRSAYLTILNWHRDSDKRPQRGFTPKPTWENKLSKFQEMYKEAEVLEREAK